MRDPAPHRKRILVLFPNGWDRRQLRACQADWRDRFEVVESSPADDDCAWDFDICGYVDRLVAESASGAQGVISSSDYPGAIAAAAVATALGLPGPTPDAVLRASHKHASRVAQQRSVPEAVPPFAVVDPARPDVAAKIGFPCFVKPLKGAFSRFARRIDSAAELASFLADPPVGDYLRHHGEMFNRLLRRYLDLPHDAHRLVVEGLLEGEQVTVEGFVRDEGVEILGVVDSVFADTPGGGRSFARFDYPSALPRMVQERMERIAARAADGLGLRRTFFNVEMTYDAATGRIGIIEVNPRICGQFADLYAKVDGVNAYVLALELAAGERRDGIDLPRRRGRFAAASSFPLRVYEPVLVERAPSDADVARVEDEHAGALVWVECTAGQELRDFLAEDGRSIRYAVVNVGGAHRADVESARDAVVRALGFRFAPVARPRRRPDDLSRTAPTRS